MNIKLLTNEEQEELRKSEHITEVTERTVKFSPEFKKLAYSELKKGRKMRDVFTENGIDVGVLGMTRVYGFTRTLKVKAAENDGFSDGRAKNGKKPADAKDMGDDDWRDSTDERIAYLEQEVEFLKKLGSLYGSEDNLGEWFSPEERFQIIDQACKKHNNMLSITKLRETACVSRSGYYSWKNSEEKRREREYQDLQDFYLIKQAFDYRGYQKGARRIYCSLLHIGVQMNIKKIRRLMKKYGLRCGIRKRNPYKKMMQASQESRTAPNLVKRRFFEAGPRKILLTDITYLFYSGGQCYLSTILDACTREILAYRLSPNLRIDFVIETVDGLMEKYDADLDDNVVIHSDQGVHYTSKQFIGKLRDSGVSQSMSRKGNCWDNAPQESFFGHMKDEIKNLVFEKKSFDEVQEVVDDWLDYYNNERYQMSLMKLSPKQYYEYLTSGYDPLAAYRN